MKTLFDIIFGIFQFIGWLIILIGLMFWLSRDTDEEILNKETETQSTKAHIEVLEDQHR